MKKKGEKKMNQKEKDLRDALSMALEYIDAIPKDVAEKFPAMPGFDRDLADSLLDLGFGCHCDLMPEEDPDGCVIDEGRPQDCIYAESVMKAGGKHKCEYWRKIR